MEQIVKLTSAELKKEGESKHGPWALRIFKDAGGNKYQTFNVDLGEKAAGLVGKTVEVRFEVEQNGEYENKVLKAVREVEGQQQISTPQQIAENFPVPVSAPVSAPTPAPQDARQQTINRSAALARAIEAHAAGVAVSNDASQLFAVADVFVKYIEGDPALTSAPSSQAQASPEA